MALAVAWLIAIPLLLLILAAVLLAQAVIGSRRGSLTQATSVLLGIAGAGVLASGCVSLAFLVSDMQYGIIIWPFLGLILGVTCAVTVGGSALVVESVLRRRERRRAASDPPPPGEDHARPVVER